jgi:O-antigen/teichoic acid export membrane protein
MGNQYIDRVFVAYLLGTTALGGYSLAAQISLTLSVLNNSLNKSFLRQTLKAFDGRKVKSLFNIANCHVTIVSIAATCISIWAEKIVEFMSGGGYEDSIYILIILTVHQVASSVYLKLCGPLYYFKEKSHYLFRISAAVFIINSISTIILIKAYGLIGASIGAVLSVVFVLFVIHKINMKFFDLCFPVKSYFCMILIPLILGLLSYWVGMILLSWIMMISYVLGAFFFFWRDMDAIYIKQKI